MPFIFGIDNYRRALTQCMLQLFIDLQLHYSNSLRITPNGKQWSIPVKQVLEKHEDFTYRAHVCLYLQPEYGDAALKMMC